MSRPVIVVLRRLFDTFVELLVDFSDGSAKANKKDDSAYHFDK